MTTSLYQYSNTSTKTFGRISTDERSIVNTHSIDITGKFAVGIKVTKTNFLHYISYRNFINDLIKHVSLQILFHIRPIFCPNCILQALLLLKNIGLDTMILFTKGTELTIVGQFEIPMKLSINSKQK